jgi:hypothetical protein
MLIDFPDPTRRLATRTVSAEIREIDIREAPLAFRITAFETEFGTRWAEGAPLGPCR